MGRVRSDFALWVISGIAVLAAASYAIIPPAVPVRRLSTPAGTEPGENKTAANTTQATLDRGAFDVDLWIDPPPPPPAPKPRQEHTARPPEPPPALDLIAITHSEGMYTAILYDTRANTLRAVTEGDTLGPYTVATIGPVTVRLEHRGRSVSLGLDQPGSPAWPGSIPMGEHATGVAMIMAEELYWAVIDTSGLPPIPFGPLRPSAVRGRLAHLFDPALPVPVEDIHAVYIPIDGQRVLACGVAREHIARLKQEGHSGAVPDRLPREVIDSIDLDLDPNAINMLRGEFRPIAETRRNRRRRTMLTATCAITAALVTIGNVRRETAARAASADLRYDQSLIYQHIFGGSASAGTTPPSVRLTTELRRLSATRGEQTTFEQPRAGLDLQDVLLRWPEDTEIRVERLSVRPGRIDITAEAADAGTINTLIEALGELDGWSLESSRTDRGGGIAADTVRLRVGYERVDKGGAP